MTGHEYYVVEFKDPPVMDLDRYICVPKTWIGRPFQDQTPQSSNVVVKYPLERQSATKSRVKKYEDYEEDWKIYIASVIYKFDNYKDAMAYIKLLNKSNKGFFKHHSEQDDRSILNQSVDSDTAHHSSPGKAKSTDNGPRESSGTPKNKKTVIKRKYTKKIQKKNNSSDDTRANNASVNGNASTCETVTEDLNTLKQDLLRFFDKFLPIVERFENNIAQNSIVLEKILTILVNQSNRPNIDAAIESTQNNAEEGEIGNQTKSAQGNSGVGVDDPVATTSTDTTPIAEDMEEVQMSVEDPKTKNITTTSSPENTTAGDVEPVVRPDRPQVSGIPTEGTSSERQGTKRKLADADANIPMKKRDGPRNPTLQHGENAAEITLNNETARLVESVAVNNPDFMVPLSFITFINDALKISSLYTKN